MLKWGFEKEFFLLDAENKPLIVDGDFRTLPYDECGWLVEARGKPSTSVVDAVFSLKADIYQIEQRLAALNAKAKSPARLSDTPVFKVDRKTRIEAARRYQKPMIHYQNFYGHAHHRNTQYEATAGVHVSVTCPDSVFVRAGEKGTQDQYKEFNGNFDWPRIFVVLDKEFKEEIKAAKRNPGFYEMKPDGRVEYRSLPSNVDLDKLIRVLQSFA